MKIKAIDLSKLRNSEFIQFIRQTTQLLADNDPVVLKVETQYNTLASQLLSLEDLHKKSLSSTLTATIETLDKERDNALTSIGMIVDGYLNAPDASLQDAAALLKSSIKNYGNSFSEITRLNYNAQTASLISLMNEWEGSADITAAISALSLTNFVAQLKTANTNFDTAYKQRTQEYAEATPESVSETRIAVLPNYYELRDVLEAYEIVESAPERLTAMHQLNALIDQYNNLLTTRSSKKLDTISSE